MRNEQIPMTAKLVVLSLFGLIVLFIYILSAEYHSNLYQQTWVANNLPWLDYFLNGYMAAALVGTFLGGLVLLLADYLKTKNRRGGLKTVF
jgi:hypothetical protein